MVKVPVFSPPYGGFPNLDKGLGLEAAFAFRCGARRMKSTGEAVYFFKDLKDSFYHCEARLCGTWQVYGERCMYLSRLAAMRSVWTIVLLWGCVVLLSCGDRVEPHGQQGDAHTSMPLDLASVVRSFRNEIGQQARGAEMSVVVSVSNDGTQCEVLVSNYYTRVLCTELYFVDLDGAPVFVADERGCLQPLLQGMSLRTEHCERMPLDEQVKLPIYDPPVWTYAIDRGTLTFVKRTR
jgi:hypothetical protein